MPPKTTDLALRRPATSTSVARTRSSSCEDKRAAARVARALLRAFAPCLLLFVLPALACAQSPRLPTPDRVVADYVRAIGGRKRLAALRDASYE